MKFILESESLPPDDAITDWEVIRMSKESMIVLLTFLDPLLVSTGQSEDRLVITVKNPSLFVT